jgi:hypothetical protein
MRNNVLPQNFAAMEPLQAQVTGLHPNTDYQIRKEDGPSILTFGGRFALLLPILGTQLTTLDSLVVINMYRCIKNVLKHIMYIYLTEKQKLGRRINIFCLTDGRNKKGTP